MLIAKAPVSKYMSYDDALLYCAFCNHNGYNNWRIPTRYEQRRHRMTGWCLEDDARSPYYSTVLPVRDIC
jgi:hypothetical protein